MELLLTSVQRRTLADLVDVREGRVFEPGLDQRLRLRIEAAIEEGGQVPPAPVRLWKERMNDLARCQGLFGALMAGEGEPFRYGLRSAQGTLVHKAIELEAGSSRALDPHELAGRAATCLEDDRQFAPYWDGLDGLDRDRLLMAAVQTLESFRASFPPLGSLRRELVPVSEHWLETSVLGGRITVVGRVDLMLNRPDPVRSTRVLVDLKTGRAWPDHPEDMRLYALLYTLRYGVPPFRVATLFLSSGVPQAELVSEEVLEHAADRLAGAVRTAVALAAGTAPELSPGPHCGRCPRRSSCPAVAAMAEGGSDPDESSRWQSSPRSSE
jgi:PD-(D/E)XK nuclease superfamily protein